MSELFPSARTRRLLQQLANPTIYALDSSYRRLCEPPYITPTREGADPYPAPHHYRDVPQKKESED